MSSVSACASNPTNTTDDTTHEMAKTWNSRKFALKNAWRSFTVAETGMELVHDLNDTQHSVFGVGIDTSITLAPIRAVVSAINKLVTQ